jgi:peptide/nickel transport system permease protein
VSRSIVLGFVLLGLLGGAGLAAPFLTAQKMLASPLQEDMSSRLQAPSAAHWLGTDELGRDVLSRLLHGAWLSLTVAIVATAVSLILGVPAGVLAGLRGGWYDLALTRLMEVTSALPALPLVLLVVSMTLGSEGGGGAFLGTTLLASTIGVTRWAVIARYVRGGIWKARAEDYAAAAVALGSSELRCAARHLLPGALAPAMVSAAFAAGSSVLIESALSFLGLGTQPPAPSWGHMVATAVNEPHAWWLLAAPGAAIALLVMAFNLIAEGMRTYGGAPAAVLDDRTAPASVRA